MKTTFNPIFLGLKTYNHKNVKFLENFSCETKDKENTPYTVSTKDEENYGWYNISYNTKNQTQPDAEQQIMIYPDIEYMFIDNMYSANESRNKGLGTCMHLTNIIYMFENNLNQIELYSTSQAIPFHIKFGYKPVDKWNTGLAKNIREISNDYTEYLKKHSLEADFLLKSNFSDELKSSLGNKLLYRYTKDALNCKSKEELEYLFSKGTPMILTKKSILKNKDFYNNLFKKYKIDYQITDYSY